MKRAVIASALWGVAFIGLTGPGVSAQDVLKERLAAAKQAAAANQKALRAYSWIEKTEVFVKGELKSTKVDSCRYGLTGEVEKTPVVVPPPPQSGRGLKGRIAKGKIEDMTAELKATAALVHRYVPPDPGLIQVVLNAGTASISQAGPQNLAVKFPGYAKAGDALTLTFEKAIKTLRQIDVTTWVEKPEEPASLKVTMRSLPDGTDYPSGIVLGIPHSKVEVRITNSNYQKIAQ